MNRLRATNSVPFASRDLAPGSGTPQYATSGNPGVTPATINPAYFTNMVMDELMALIAAAGAAADDANWNQVWQALGRCWTFQDTGTANHLAVALPSGVSFPSAALGVGTLVRVQVANTCTAPSDLTLFGLPTKPVKRLSGIDTIGGEWVAGRVIELVYDGTNFQLLSSCVPALYVDLLTASGDWTPRGGVTTYEGEMWAPGGGGGGAHSTSAAAAGAGGGGGEFVAFHGTCYPGEVFVYSQGAPGAGGSNTGAAGANATGSSFGGISAFGGVGGGGGSDAGGSPGGTGGSGGTGGDYHIAGQRGGTPAAIATGYASGVGGHAYAYAGALFATGTNPGGAGLYGAGGSGGVVLNGGGGEAGGQGGAGLLIIRSRAA